MTVLLVFSLSLLFVRPGVSAEPEELVCEIQTPDAVYRYPVSKTGVHTVVSAGVTLTVTIENGSVFVTEADCPDQICVHTPPISRAGDVIACVPGEILIRLDGRSGGKEEHEDIRVG